MIANKSNVNSMPWVNRRWPAGFLALESLLLLSVLVSSLIIISFWAKKQALDTRIRCQAKQLKYVSHHAYQATIDNWQTLTQSHQPPIDLNHSDIFTLPPGTPLQNYQRKLLQNENQKWQLWITPHKQPPLTLKSCLKLRAQVGKHAGCIVQDKEKKFIVSGWNNLWHTTWPAELDKPQINQIVLLQSIESISLWDASAVLYRKTPLAGKSITNNNFSTDLAIHEKKITFKNGKQVSEFSSEQSKFSNGQQLIDIKNNRESSIQLKNDVFYESKLDPQGISFHTRLLPGDHDNKKSFLQLHNFLFYYLEYCTTKSKFFDVFSFLKAKQHRVEYRYPQITSQINPFWNKVPNFEHSFTGKNKGKILQEFSNHMCNEFIDKNNKHRALGRIFSLREKNRINNFKIFICAVDSEGKNIVAHPWTLYTDYHKIDKNNSKQFIELNLTEQEEDSVEDYFNFLKVIAKHLIAIEKIVEGLPNLGDDLLNTIQEDASIKELGIEKEHLKYYYDFLLKNPIGNLGIKPQVVYQYLEDKKNGDELKYFISVLEKYPDDLDSNLTLLLENIFLKLSTDEKYEHFFFIKNKIPKIIGLSLPDKIENNETAEEILSLFIILSNKIVDANHTLTSKKFVFFQVCNSIYNMLFNNSNHKNEVESKKLNKSFPDILSNNLEARFNEILPELKEIMLSDKTKLIKDFISYYNGEGNSGNTVKLFKESKLQKLIEKTKAVPDTGQTYEKILNDSIYEVVNEHFRHSQVIKIKYP